jgi:uncharacterized protein
VKFLVAGSSGFLGTALRIRLAEQGHEVVRLVRREPASPVEYQWNPELGELNVAALDGVQVAVNLAGVGLADRPWTKSRRALILSSRVQSTSTLARALASRPEQATLIQMAGISRYGTTSSPQPFDEDSPAGTDYLSQVVVKWEAAAQPAIDAGVRTVILRTSPVMDSSGGALKTMKLPWTLGLGAQIGDGQQHMPVVSMEDYLRIVEWAVNTPTASGPYNVTLPEPVTNAEFTRVLGEVLGRPTVLRAPGIALRSALGQLAEQLLGDMYVVPARLIQQGFTFLHPDLESTLRSALHR